MIPVVFFVIVITFVLMHSAAGSPWDKAGGRQLSQVVVDNLNKKYGLDKPIFQQFLLYLWNVLHFDFGLSYQYQGKSVVQLISEGWPYTAILGTLAFLLIVPVGVGLGVLAALRQNTRVDYATMGFATLAASFPNFVIGALMVVLFSVLTYKWTGGNFFLPAGGWGIDDHLIMPVITLARLHGTAHPSQHPGDDPPGLHPHRLGEGSSGAPRRRPPRPQELLDPGRDDPRADVRLPGHGLSHSRDGLQHPRHRPRVRRRRHVA
jgi:ABC-type dipeptide/oligopeptide/nickel transport system permease component